MPVSSVGASQPSETAGRARSPGTSARIRPRDDSHPRSPTLPQQTPLHCQPWLISFPSRPPEPRRQLVERFLYTLRIEDDDALAAALDVDLVPPTIRRHRTVNFG